MPLACCPGGPPFLLADGAGPLVAVLVALVAAGVALVLGRRARREAARAEAAERRARLLLDRDERDRRRVAEALHDGPVQDLLALGMGASVAAYVGRPAEAGGLAAPDDVARVTRALQDVSESLRPPSLEAFGLAAAVRAHADRFRERHPGIRLDLDLDDDDLPPPSRLALFRITQEALDNAALHGLPLRIEVGLEATGTGAELTVRDDGEGYEVPADVTAFAATGRYGVLGMLAQAEAVGATLRLESAPGRTVVRVAVPPSGP